MILSSSIVARRNFNYDSFNIFDIQSFVPFFIIGTETYFQVSTVWSFISEIWIFFFKTRDEYWVFGISQDALLVVCPDII